MRLLSDTLTATAALAIVLTAGATRASDHWAFQPVVRPDAPAVGNQAWVRNSIDRFVLARLDAANIAPSPEADRTTLIRRLSLDLCGLLPSPDEVDAFLADAASGAYGRLVERLLGSPHFGERWGRHWLDLARYADSNGYTRDFGRQIWRYRDWVIDAFNRDVPFDRFTVEQIAGDMLPDATLEQRIATGFHRNTLINEEGGTDKEQFRVDAVADRVNTTGAVFLGLTVGCARCHDHKYDPISQTEYYQLFAFLDNCDEPRIDAPTPAHRASGALEKRAAIREKIKALEEKLAGEREAFTEKQLAWEKAITPEQRVRLPGPTQEALMLALDKRTAEQKKLIAELYKKTDEARKAFPAADRIARLRAAEPKIPTTMILRERKTPRETHVHLRGNFLTKGDRVFPAVPAVLHPLRVGSKSASRLDFARWLVDPANPLTPRVVMNRFWQRLFGNAIVDTENDFGTQGSPPTHPALLDWLAAEFVARGWGMKEMIRLIVTSATYRQASHHRPELADRDRENRLLARQSRTRLDAEIVRDAALSAAGLLTPKVGGPGVFPPQPDGVFDFTQDAKPWRTATGADRFRRGMYTHFWRSSPYPSLMVFDFPNSNITCTRRVRSNTPLQALALANDTAFVECARALAARALAEEPSDDATRLTLMFRRALARPPTGDETRRLLTLARRQQEAFTRDTDAARALLARENGTDDDPRRAAWTTVARVLLNLDEFITRE